MLKNKRILIIGKVWPEPKSSAAGIRMMQLISFFQEKEMDITFVSAANTSEFQFDLNEIEIEFEQIKLNDDSFDSYVKELNPEIVVFDRFLTEEQFGWRVDKNCPDAIKVLNTEDLHFLRNAREDAVKKEVELDVTSIRTDMFQRELLSIHRSDMTLLVSEFERDLLVDHYSVSQKQLHYLPVFSEVKNDVLSFEDRKDFMFIGNFYHAPNWDAVKELKLKIWPLIRAKLPSTNLHVYGAYCGQKVKDFHNEKEGFIVHGRADDVQVVTETARVSLVPLRFGAGIKGKLLDAMSVGTPTVTSTIGAEAMMLNEKWNGYVEDNTTLFSSAAIELFTNKESWKQAQDNGFEILKSKFNKNDFKESFYSEIKHLLNYREEVRKENVFGTLAKHHSLQSSKYLSKWIMEKNR